MKFQFLLSNLPAKTTSTRSLTHNQRVRIVATLARQLMKVNSDHSLSTALKTAWAIVKEHESDLQVVRFKTVKGDIKNRVVFVQPWSSFYEVKGTGRPKPEGLKLFVDVAKYVSEKNATVSAYENRILEIL